MSHAQHAHRPALWYLQKVDLFANMTDEEMMEIMVDMQHGEYPCKHLLYSPDMPTEHTYILKEGEVTLYQKVKNKVMVLDILKPGAIFGNILFNPDDGEGGHYAEVTQSAFICTLPKDFFVTLTAVHPQLALNALKALSSRLTQYQTQLKLLSMLSARERILVTVQLLNEKERKSILPAILRRPTKVTHEKLANMTGLTRETVTKQLQELEQERLIYVHKKQIQLTEAGNAVVQEIL